MRQSPVISLFDLDTPTCEHGRADACLSCDYTADLQATLDAETARFATLDIAPTSTPTTSER